MKGGPATQMLHLYGVQILVAGPLVRRCSEAFFCFVFCYDTNQPSSVDIYGRQYIYLTDRQTERKE